MMRSLRVYLRVLAIFYFVGAILHLEDILNLRLPLSEMSWDWKVWIWYLLICDSIAAVGLWMQKGWGEGAFLLVATSQLMIYGGFPERFGPQTDLLIFHVATLTIYFVLRLRQFRYHRSGSA